MSKPRLLSLCSGIGGLDLAAEWAGFEVAGQVEIDDFCRAVLSKHWPDVPRMEDIRDVCGDEFGRVDVLAGGIPCQGNSVAGQRRGRADDRYLWPEMARLIRATQPAWVVVENVPGMRSVDGGELFADVLRDLAQLGYRVGWVSLEAAEVGAPHKRERVFIVGYLAHADQYSGRWSQRAGCDDLGGAPVAHALGEGHSQRDAAQRGRTGMADAPRGTRQRQAPRLTGHAALGDEAMEHASGTGWEERRTPAEPGSAGHLAGRSATAGHDGQAQPRLGESTDGLPRRLDFPGWPAGPTQAQHEWEAPRVVTGTVPQRAQRLKALGNAIVPQQVYPVLAAIRATFPPAERSA